MKACPFCAEQIQDTAVKCRFCNSMLTAGAPAPPLQAAGGALYNPQGAAALPPTDPSHARVFFHGAPSWKSRFWKYVFACLLVVVGLAIAGFLGVSHDGEATVGPLAGPIGGAVLAAIGVVYFLVQHFGRTSHNVRITSETIDIETGLLGKSIHTIQLWRIRDIDYEQTFTERLLGISRLHVLSHDQERPNVTLLGLPSGRQLFTDMRDAIAIARQGKNVVGVVD